jgi:hypothetical protein
MIVEEDLQLGVFHSHPPEGRFNTVERGLVLRMAKWKGKKYQYQKKQLMSNGNHAANILEN